jgi:hypothetical protein
MLVVTRAEPAWKGELEEAAKRVRGVNLMELAAMIQIRPDHRCLCAPGPMFAGKSTELMRRIRRHKLASRKCEPPPPYAHALSSGAF